MRQITVTFNSASKIQKLKKIMKQVYTSGNDNVPEIAKFNLNKDFIPEKVDRVEITIKKVVGESVTINISKASLTFFTGFHPFNPIAGSHELSGKYIVLPWNITTNSGKEGLKNIIGKITTSTSSVKYTLYVDNTGENVGSDTISQADLNLSENSFEDNTEELFSRIRELEDRLRLVDQSLTNANVEVIRQQNLVQQRDAQISNLNNQVSNLNSQISNISGQVNQRQNRINDLNNQVARLSKNEVTWDTRITNQTTLNCVGFTDKVIATINPSNGTFNLNIV
jgi:predicted  nucleic acid-binding Zn-ribbon protein